MEALDTVFDLLSEERRRFVLYYLEQQSGPVPVAKVAAKVEAWETGDAVADDIEAVDDDLLIRLVHQDIPKLRSVEYVEYDPERREIEISGEPTEVNVLLSVTEAIEQPREDDVVHL